MAHNESTDEEQTLRRRRVLGLLGGGTAGVVLGSGVGAANPGRGNGNNGVGPCTCDECPEGTFCGKVEGKPEEGKTYTFSADGDSFSVTIDEVWTKDGGEVTCFEFSTTDNVEKVCIKGGPDTATYTSGLDGKLCAPENPGGQQAAISNFSFCGTAGPEYYQVDLVEGEVIEDFGESGPYGSDRRYTDFSVCEDGTVTSGSINEDGTATKNGCQLQWTGLGFDASDNTVDVDVTLLDADEEPCTITLAGYLLPGNDTVFKPGNIDDEELRDYDTVSLDVDDSETLTIDLDG